MSWLRTLSTLPLKLRALFRRDSAERDLNDELRYHVEQLTQRNIENGMSRDDARRAALLSLEGVEQQKEACRDTRGVSHIEHLWLDLKFGARMLRKAPGFTIVAVTALALGIGANTAVFSLVYGVLYRPLPYPQSERLAMVFLHFSPQNERYGTMSAADYFDWRAGNHSFVDPSIFTFARFNLTGSGTSEQVGGASVSAGFFSTLGAEPLAGRFFRMGEDSASSPRLVVIGESLWRRRFGSRVDVIGSVIPVNGEPTTIIGIAPASIEFPRPETEMWTNLQLVPPTRRGPFFFRGIARLKPAVTLAQARAETNAIARQIERTNAGTYSQLTIPVVSLREALVGDVRRPLMVIFGAVAFVLLIGIVNVANLLLGRASIRGREISLRLGLGASRARVWQQLMTESVLLGVVGGAAGIAVAWSALRLLRAWSPGGIPRLDTVHLDWPVLLFTAAAALLSGVLFGTMPALHTSRSGLNIALNEGSRGNSGAAGGRTARSALVVVEIALSLVLLCGGGLLLRSYILLTRVDSGIAAPAETVLSMRISRDAPPKEKDEVALAFFDRVVGRLEHLPGVMGVALTDTLPQSGGEDTDTFGIEGRAWTQSEFPATIMVGVGPDYFRSLAVPVLRGRAFTAGDRPDKPPVAIISESLAKSYFPGEDPIGHRIRRSQPELNNPWTTIVGVVADVKYLSLTSTSDPAIYFPFAQNVQNRTWLLVRSAVPASSLAGVIAHEIHDVDPNVVVNRPTTLEQLQSQSVAEPRFRAYIVGLFAAIALLLAAVGTYGVMAYSVSQRTTEIGVRMALGARRRDVMRMVIGQGFELTAAGLGIGLIAGLGVTRVLRDLLFGIKSDDPLTFAVVTALLLAVAAVACAYPAWRATRVDPIIALRHD